MSMVAFGSDGDPVDECWASPSEHARYACDRKDVLPCCGLCLTHHKAIVPALADRDSSALSAT